MSDATPDRGERPAGHLATGIKQAERAAATRLDRMLKPMGLTKSRFGVLQALQHLERASSAALARTVFITPQAMVGIVAWLERSGYIRRNASKASARVIETIVTEDGVAAYKEGADAMRKVDRMIESEFDQAELAELRRYLTRVVTVLQRKPPDGQ